MYREVENYPFQDKRYGFVLNIARFILVKPELWTFSGGVSLFNAKNSVEIAFPIYLAHLLIFPTITI